MLRRAAVIVIALGIATAAAGATKGLVSVPKPLFPPASDRIEPSRQRLAMISTARRSPAYTPRPETGAVVPARLAGQPMALAFRQPGTTFAVYGTGVLAGFGPRANLKYAYDLRSFGFPPRALVPNAYGPQEVVWARQIGRTLVVQTNHLGYASDSGGRNGYLTGIDIDTGKVRWRSPALVANADNFVVVKGMVVSGYGFTAEKDWLYLVDPATGTVRDRLALPSMAERISVSGDRIVVRCYDAKVVARLV